MNAKVEFETVGSRTSGRLVGRCVEAGDDDEGQPRIVIHTTREDLKRFRFNLIFSEVEVSARNPNDKS